MAEHIQITGARTHNLKNIDVQLPRNQLVVVTGVSGSGKSSLAFDTLYAEGQRRYVESLSAYARQFLSLMDKPDVDEISGLSPSIAIEQKSTSHNPRSTVGTVTEIHDYLRLMFARVGVPHCPEHGIALAAMTVSQMVDEIMTFPADTALMILAPLVQDRKGEHVKLLQQCMAQGFVRARIDGEVVDLADAPELAPRKTHTIELVVDRLKVKPERAQRLSESLELALAHSEGLVRIVSLEGGIDQLYSASFACPHCGFSLAALEPRLFSFNSPHGACSRCDGLGVEQGFDADRLVADETLSLSHGAIRGWDARHFYYHQLLKALAEHDGFSMDTPFNGLPEEARHRILHGTGREKIQFHFKLERGRTIKRNKPFAGVLPTLNKRYQETDSTMVREELAKFISTSPCTGCEGQRLNPSACHVKVSKYTLSQLCAMPIDVLHGAFQKMKLKAREAKIAEKILEEIRDRLSFLMNVGLEYLTLGRAAETLSGGEAQRIRLASQIGSGLVGVSYVLDEPSIGLHQRDNQRLLSTLTHLRDLGNTVVVVEHDEEAIRSADHVIDMGPGAGVQGGEVVASGTPSKVAKAKTLTGDYLSGRKKIQVPKKRVPVDPKKIMRFKGMTHNNLKNVDIEIPAGLFTCVTGVSGSGKSSLINHTLHPALSQLLNRANPHTIGAYTAAEGLDLFDKVIAIDQSPIGRTPRSNPATYTGLLTPIRELFAATPEARARGYKIGRFSFNVKGGRCEACQGDGVTKVEMHFLPDVYVACDVCHSQRYNRETLAVKYKGKNIHEVLSMNVAQALDFFSAIPTIARRCQTLMDVGLSYISLGQNAVTLSGGEAQRIKLAKELSKRDSGRTIYLLDEPTTGLHFHDVKQLLDVLMHLRDRGNTLVVIEHNLDVIKMADWLIDMGPEGGGGGGQVVAMGTPEDLAKCKASHTGRFLKPLLK